MIELQSQNETVFFEKKTFVNIDFHRKDSKTKFNPAKSSRLVEIIIFIIGFCLNKYVFAVIHLNKIDVTSKSFKM